MMSRQSNRTSTRSNLAVDLRRIPGLDIVADKALVGFLRVLIEVNRDKQILAYRTDKRLMVDSKEFLLRMGFGIHAGWAIEGAVGSLQKVDATYLSPHVNMAARMEAATRQFGVPVLMTERFVEVGSCVFIFSRNIVTKLISTFFSCFCSAHVITGTRALS
jgi:hypothetical protein